jgi:hypothetical protein
LPLIFFPFLFLFSWSSPPALGNLISDCGVKSVPPTFFDRHPFLVSVIERGTSRLAYNLAQGGPPLFRL